jgi:hypothetical protein
MKIYASRKRDFNVPASKIGALLNTLASDNDQFWPIAKWEPIKCDGNFAVGTTGGHGPFQYQINEYIPGKKVSFQFDATAGSCKGLYGSHHFEVEILSENRSRLKHVLHADCSPSTYLRWIFMFRSLHHALILDLMDNVEYRLTDEIKYPAKWSLPVRFLRLFWNKKWKVKEQNILVSETP